MAKVLIPRGYNKTLTRLLQSGKVLFIVGPRRAGKTTFLAQFVKEKFSDKKVKVVTGDNLHTQRILSSPILRNLLEFVSGYDVLVIDEVQHIPNVGLSLKLLVDNLPNLYILATGSASLDIVQKAGEPLVGRKFTVELFPFSVYELRRFYFANDYELRESLESMILYGTYPEVFLAETTKMKEDLLYELVGSYLFRDILQLERLRYPFILEKLLKLLAYQIGSTVSYHELATQLGIDVKTVEKYLWLLEKSYILVELWNFSRNKRNELKKSKKFYFVDLGVRNALIGDFSPLDLRPDRGALWENFMIIERIKKNKILSKHMNSYFWRTKTKQEIDWVEERGGKLYPYEFKLTSEKIKVPKLFYEYYPMAEKIQVITMNNFLRFVG